MRTTEEILARIAAVKDDDWMGTQTSDLLMFLPYEAAKPFLADGWGQEKFEQAQRSGGGTPKERIRDYLSFAWDKANNCRGLSAGRSLEHIMTWLWLAGYENADAEFSDYSHYGKKQLVIASLLVDFDFERHDDGAWVNSEDDRPLSKDDRAIEIAAATVIAKSMTMA